MIIDGENFIINNVFESIATVPDCFVVSSNKIGTAHGEAKFYFTSKNKTRAFFGSVGFYAKCFILKQDVLNYLNTIKTEYFEPSQEYREKDNLASLWEQRYLQALQMNDVETFTIFDQTQIQGDRGYVNAIKDDDFGYQLIRNISLPLVSFIQVMELKDRGNSSIFYWKLFVDFELLNEKKRIQQVLYYGKNSDTPTPNIETNTSVLQLSRIGQERFRSQLLSECPFCPITMVADSRLLIASHIKPWAVSTAAERIDPKNGFMLSPVYDKLFDRGFITFTNDKRLIVSNWINPAELDKLHVINNKYYSLLPVKDREIYLQYHRESVFKG